MSEPQPPPQSRVIDMDSHVVEPDDLWITYIDKKYRRNAPRAVLDSWGMKRLMVESRLYPTPEGRGRAPRFVLNEENQAAHKRRIETASNPAQRVAVMNAIGVDQAVLMPSQGFFLGSVVDPGLAAACAWAYNTWLAEFCGDYPDRLLGAAILPLQDIRAAVREVERAATQLNFCGVYVRPNPVGGRTLLDPVYNPVMEACQSYGLPLLVHEGCGFAPGATVGIDRFENGLFSHAISHPMEMMLSVLSIICGGVLERFPGLKVAFLEAGCGWAPFWLNRLDEHAELLGWELPWLTMVPSEYFRRQCVISCDPDERHVNWVVEELGESAVVMITDYPHIDYASDGNVSDYRCFEGLTAGQKRAVLSNNPVRILRGQALNVAPPATPVRV